MNKKDEPTPKDPAQPKAPEPAKKSVPKRSPAAPPSSAPRPPMGEDPIPSTPVHPPNPPAPNTPVDDCTFTREDDQPPESPGSGEEDEPEPGDAPPEAPAPIAPRVPPPKTAKREHRKAHQPDGPADQVREAQIAAIAAKLIREKIVVSHRTASELARALAIIVLDIGIPITPAKFVDLLWKLHGAKTVRTLTENLKKNLA